MFRFNFNAPDLWFRFVSFRSTDDLAVSFCFVHMENDAAFRVLCFVFSFPTRHIFSGEVCFFMFPHFGSRPSYRNRTVVRISAVGAVLEHHTGTTDSCTSCSYHTSALPFTADGVPVTNSAVLYSWYRHYGHYCTAQRPVSTHQQSLISPLPRVRLQGETVRKRLPLPEFLCESPRGGA